MSHKKRTFPGNLRRVSLSIRSSWIATKDGARGILGSKIVHAAANLGGFAWEERTACHTSRTHTKRDAHWRQVSGPLHFFPRFACYMRIGWKRRAALPKGFCKKAMLAPSFFSPLPHGMILAWPFPIRLSSNCPWIRSVRLEMALWRRPCRHGKRKKLKFKLLADRNLWHLIRIYCDESLIQPLCRRLATIVFFSRISPVFLHSDLSINEKIEFFLCTLFLGGGGNFGNWTFCCIVFCRVRSIRVKKKARTVKKKSVPFFSFFYWWLQHITIIRIFFMLGRA